MRVGIWIPWYFLQYEYILSMFFQTNCVSFYISQDSIKIIFIHTEEVAVVFPSYYRGRSK